MRTLTSPRHLLSLLLVTATALSATACSDDDAPGQGAPPSDADAVDFELFSTTRQLTDADLAALSAANDDGTLAFSSEPAGLAGIEPGAVLLGPISAKTPAGLLRGVTSVERGGPGGALVLHTVAVPPSVAFKKLHARVARRAAEPFVPSTSFVVKDMSPMALRPNFTVATGRGEREQSYQFVVFDGDGDSSTKNDQVVIDATLGGGFNYSLQIDVDWGGITDLPRIIVECIASIGKIVTGETPKCSIDDLLPEAKTTFNVDPFVTIDVNASGAAALEFEKKLELGTIDLTPYAVGPLVFAPTVDIVAKVGGGASARFDVGAKARAEMESAVTLSSKTGAPQYSPPKLKDYSVDPREPTLNLHAFAEASVGARLALQLYGIAGPYATASGVARIDATPLEDPCWSLRFALESELGVRIRPRLPFVGYVNIADFKAEPFRPFDEVVAKGSCTIPPDPPAAPGSGPTPSKIATPAFTPWAKLIGGSVDGLTSDTGTFLLASPELTPSIDGRYIGAGAWAYGLHKIDGDGVLTWTSALTTSNGDAVLRSLRSVPTRDAGLMALVQPRDTAAFVLAKAGQSGAIAWTKSYALPSECIAHPLHIMNDAADGFLVLGDCAGGEAWMVHVNANGDVVRASTIREEGSNRIRPTVGITNAGELIVGGEVARPGELEWTFVSRLGAEDQPGVSTAFHCPDRIAMQPASMIPAEDGGVTVVGAANGPGFVARVKKDGALGFAKFPNVGLGVASDLIVQSVAPLSTTGMVIGASTRNVSEAAPPSVILAGLDSGGSTLWSKRYALASPAPRSLASPSLRVTDDGGIFVTAIAGPANGREGDLYAMKVFTKDGFLGEGTPITSSDAGLEPYVCTMATRPFAPTLTAVAVTVSPTDLKRR